MSLSVRALTLSHFRSHKRVEMEVSPGPVVLHGANGAGKTNILEAVSLLSPGRGMRRAVAEDMARKPEAVGWKLSAVLDHPAGTSEIETMWEGGAGRTVRIDSKTTSQLALGRVARVVWLVPAMDRLWIEGAEGRRRFLDRMTLSFRPTHAEAVLTYEKAMRERNRLLKDGVRDPAWYGALESQMALSGAEITENRAHCLAELARAQEDAETSFPAADLTLEEPDAGGDLAAAFAASRSNDIAAGRTLIGPHRADLGAVYQAKGVAAKECSTGEQKALLVSLILANARALERDFGAAPLLLLDEVAAHLDQARQAALYDEICALGAQAWMTGTGPEHFTALGARAQYFEVVDEGGVSAVRSAGR